MDKYDKLMQEIIEFLQGTMYARGRGYLTDRGPIQGCTISEIENAEYEIGKQLPMAMRTWYRVAGKIPPYLGDYDADFSLNDLKAAQPAARLLTQYTHLKLDEYMIPFSQRVGEQIDLVDLKGADPNDPPAFHYLEGDEQPTQVGVAFTAFMREFWLVVLNPPRDYKSVKWSNEAKDFRKKFIEKVHQEDLAKGIFTGPREFQKRWVQVFSASEIGQQVLREAQGRSVPYYWIDIPK